jgi:hypothetical protein
MTAPWQPFREPLRATLLRTVVLALILGALLARWWGGGLARWPIATLLMLWPSAGGHVLEVWFLNWLRPRISPARRVQTVARVVVWFVGGSLIGLGMALTATLLGAFRPAHWPPWWLAGIAFTGIELVAHAALELRGRPSFYSGLG